MILVVIPYIDEDMELAKDTKIKHRVLAGVDCTVLTVQDVERIGWVQMHNDMAKSQAWDYYCYSCADYEPRQDYLKLAVAKLEETDNGLCGFNDGKWNGAIASVGLITRAYYDKQGLFHDGYKSHGADDEITKKAIRLNEYVYEPLAVLAEITGRKEPENKQYNKKDQELYQSRINSGLI